MALVVKVGEAKTRLSELLHRVEAGEEIILSRGPIAIARLAPLEAGGRRLALFADLRDARDTSGAAPVTSAELGLWRDLAASPPAREPHIACDRPVAEHGPAAPPGAEEYAPPADVGQGLILDPSFAAAWLLPGPDRRVADATAGSLARGPARATALLPPGFWMALGDLLLAAARRERISESAAAAQFARAGRLPLVETTLADGLDRDSDGEARAAIMRLASAHGLSFTDAACLGFARARSLPLASNSPALARAAARLGVPLLTDLRDADLA
jgi:antitoxin (DNA-binding transcriptional repressor) of toxin-antitoxin stability system